MIDTFQPPKWLKNPHLQTCLPTIISKISRCLAFQMQTIQLSDGDYIEVGQIGNVNSPCVLLMPGLEGSIRSPYIQSSAKALLKKNYQVLVMQYRGCNGKVNLKAKSYNSYDDTDLNNLLQHLISTTKQLPIYAVGFSLGGNILLHHAYNHPDTIFKGIITVSTPFDMQNTVDIMPVLYHQRFVHSMKKKLLNKLANNIPLPVTRADIKSMKSLPDIDNTTTAPLSGHSDAKAYYQHASCKNIIKHITKPILMIHALDDPFIAKDTLPDANTLPQSVILQSHDYGGHVGFISKKMRDKSRFWIGDAIALQIESHQHSKKWLNSTN